MATFVYLLYPAHARPQMPPHIHIVYRPSDPKKELIAKKVRKESNELAILKRLNTIQPSSEHVVSLLDSFYGLSGPWVILPRMVRLTHLFLSLFLTSIIEFGCHIGKPPIQLDMFLGRAELQRMLVAGTTSCCSQPNLSRSAASLLESSFR